MPSANMTVRELILSDKTYLGVLSQVANITGMHLDDIMPANKQYMYVPGSHRILIIESDYSEGWTQEDVYVAFIHVYRHEDPKNAGYMAVAQPPCGECGSEFTFFTYGSIHCYECGNETPWP